MNDEILKLAEKYSLDFLFDEETDAKNIETFYKAAYNKAIEDAAQVTMNWSSEHDHLHEECDDIAYIIRALEIK